MPSYRLAEIHHADDLQAIAAREMGDANRWPELIWLNSLSYPYVTNDESRAGEGVLLAGTFIKVPSAVGAATDDADRGQVYERDCRMALRQLQSDDSGDFAIVSGSDNLKQQLQHRLDTPRGQARRHPEYGGMQHRLKGRVNGPTAGLLAAEYVKSALLADYRVARVESSTATVQGDSTKVTARAVAIKGGVVDIVTGQNTGGEQ